MQILGESHPDDDKANNPDLELFMRAARRFEQLTPDSADVDLLWTLTTAWLNPHDVSLNKIKWVNDIDA